MIKDARQPATVPEYDPVASWLAQARHWSPDEAPTWIERLRDEGIVLPAPDDVAHGGFEAPLDRLIVALGDREVYLLHTDHLTDEALYRYLLDTALRVPCPPRQPGSAEIIDLCPPYGQSIDIMLAIYASDALRAELRHRGVAIPPRRPRAIHRDSGLPKPLGTTGPMP